MRIWPIYVCGFSISFLGLFCYRKVFFGDFVYSFKDYLVQISLLRDFFWAPSIDGISWTLEVEVKFYILVFALMLAGKLYNKYITVIISTGMTVFSIVFFANKEILIVENVRTYQIMSVLSDSFIYIIFIFIGVSIYCFYSGKWDKTTFCAVLQCLLISFVLSILNSGNNALMRKYIVNYFGAFILFLNVYAVRDRLKDNRVLQFIGDKSYSIYLLHGLTGYILLTIMFQSGIPAGICLIIAIVGVLGLATLFNQLVEKPLLHLSYLIVNKLQ